MYMVVSVDVLAHIFCVLNDSSFYASPSEHLFFPVQDLVPCVLVTFDKEQIVVWRGKNYKPDDAGRFLLRKEILENPDSKADHCPSVNSISMDDESPKSYS